VRNLTATGGVNLLVWKIFILRLKRILEISVNQLLVWMSISIPGSCRTIENCYLGNSVLAIWKVFPYYLLLKLLITAIFTLKLCRVSFYVWFIFLVKVWVISILGKHPHFRPLIMQQIDSMFMRIMWKILKPCLPCSYYR
jgi:hypothetical protein